jgi:hypothetical protein
MRTELDIKAGLVILGAEILFSKLLTIGLGIARVWLGWLPKMARHPAIQQRQAAFEARGIDPAAMFYTELELLDSPHNRFRQWQCESPDALW